jgi:hypothetical protein
MRIVLIIFLCFAAIRFMTPTTSQQLHSRYGEPDVERFAAGDDIGLTVEYGSDGLACQIVLERKQPLLHREQEPKYMRPEVVSQIIDEIVPFASRGRSINILLESMGCSEGRLEEYENVWIGRYSNMCVPLKPERESTATVVFKRTECPISRYAQLHN